MGEIEDSGNLTPEPDASQASVNSELGENEDQKIGDSPAETKVVAALTKEDVEEIVRRGNQSNKDTRLAKLEQSQEGTNKELQRMAQLLKVTPEQVGQARDVARREQLVDDLYEERYGNKSDNRQSVNSELTSSEAFEIASSVVSGSASESAVLEAVRTKAFPNAASLYKFINEQSVEHAVKPGGSNATQSLPAGSSPAASDDIAALTDQYSIDMIAARGKPNEIRAIKAQAKKNGVDVENIGFTI